jgi:hypothetical protein
MHQNPTIGQARECGGNGACLHAYESVSVIYEMRGNWLATASLNATATSNIVYRFGNLSESSSSSSVPIVNVMQTIKNCEINSKIVEFDVRIRTAVYHT